MYLVGRGQGLIQDLRDSFKLYVYVNAKHTISEWRFVGGGLKSGFGQRQTWRSSLFALYAQIKELIGLKNLLPSPSLPSAPTVKMNEASQRFLREHELLCSVTEIKV